jgi:hypothetical protein
MMGFFVISQANSLFSPRSYSCVNACLLISPETFSYNLLCVGINTVKFQREMVVTTIQNRYTYFTLNLTKNCTVVGG